VLSAEGYLLRVICLRPFAQGYLLKACLLMAVLRRLLSENPLRGNTLRILSFTDLMTQGVLQWLAYVWLAEAGWAIFEMLRRPLSKIGHPKKYKG